MVRAREKKTNKRNEQNGVIITVYIESESSSSSSSRYNGPADPRKPNKAFTKYGYDRRAQLLAHARRLRRAESAEYNYSDFGGPKTKTRSKTEKWRWRWRRRWRWKWKASSAKLRRSFRRIFKKKERDYDRIEKETINRNTAWRDSIFCQRLTRMVAGCYGQDDRKVS